MSLTKEDLKSIEKLLSPRFDSIDGRLDKLEQRMDGLEQRMGELEQKMEVLDKKVFVLEKRMDTFTNTAIDRFDCLSGQITEVFKEVESVDAKVLKLNAKENIIGNRLDRAELNISSIIKMITEYEPSVEGSIVVKDKSSRKN